MTQVKYPDMIENLPDINLDVPGVKGKLLQAGDKQLVFFEILAVGAIPPHSHGAQWGIVVDGEVEMTIGGVTQTMRKGDSYFIPAGVVHSGTVKERVLAIDIFDEPARYKPK